MLHVSSALLQTVRCHWSVLLLLCLVILMPIVCYGHDEPQRVPSGSPEPFLEQSLMFGQINGEDVLCSRRRLSKHATNLATETTDGRKSTCQGLSLSHALHDLAKFTQDELHMRSLMSSLDPNGGVKLLRDLALRIRSFKGAFKAWENIHLDEEHGTLCAQSIILRLRSMQVEDLKSVVEIYDEFRSFINSLAAKLFPWTSPYFGDLMSLHASFEGRGLVFTTGDVHASYLLTSIPAMRALGCNLPIEIMYLGDNDLSEKNRELLGALPNVLTRDISLMIDDKGWEVKGTIFVSLYQHS